MWPNLLLDLISKGKHYFNDTSPGRWCLRQRRCFESVYSVGHLRCTIFHIPLDHQNRLNPKTDVFSARFFPDNAQDPGLPSLEGRFAKLLIKVLFQGYRDLT